MTSIPRLEDEEEDLADYRFPKFAATYFQGQATHSYIRRPLKQPLLGLKNDQDRQASIDIWVMILRFMGDMQEPKFPEPAMEAQKEESLAKRLYGSISKKFGSSKAADQISAEVRCAVFAVYINSCVEELICLFKMP